jgi:hypothetical protein
MVAQWLGGWSEVSKLRGEVFRRLSVSEDPTTFRSVKPARSLASLRCRSCRVGKDKDKDRGDGGGRSSLVHDVLKFHVRRSDIPRFRSPECSKVSQESLKTQDISTPPK